MVSERRGRRAMVRALLVAGALAGACLVDYFRGPVVHLVHRADFGATAAIAIISILSSLFGLFKGKADANVSAAFFSLRNSVVDLGKKVVDYIARAGAFLASTIGAIVRFVRQFIAPLVAKIAAIIARVSRILNRILGPVIRFLQKIRGWLLKFYDKVLRPIFDTIAALRAILKILDKLGVKAAGKLDDKLAEIEDEIRGAYLQLLGKTNEILDWLNRIVTLDGLLQRVTLLNSLYSYRRDWTSQFWWSQHEPTTPAERTGLIGTIVDAPIAERAAKVRTYLRFGDGPLRARVDELALELARNLRN